MGSIALAMMHYADIKQKNSQAISIKNKANLFVRLLPNKFS